MRNTLPTLALLALAAAAHAGSYSHAATSLTTTFSAPGLTLDSVTHGQYSQRVAQGSDPSTYYYFANGVNLLGLDDWAYRGDYTPVPSPGAHATLESYEAGESLVGNTLTLSALVDERMAATPDTSVVAEANLGQRYFLTFTNPSPTEVGHVTFDLDFTQECRATADVPEDTNPLGVVDYADPTAVGAVGPVAIDPDGYARLLDRSGLRFLDVNTAYPDFSTDRSDSFHDAFSVTYDLAPGATGVYEAYVTADATLVHVPAQAVPEPASLAALGLGALALLRRPASRRKTRSV